MRVTARKIKNNYLNKKGFHTERKILVIDSDDWGSIRMPSNKVYDALLEEGDCVDQDAFLRYDCLERETDLRALYDVLSEFVDKNGRHPCITANFAVANPDFSKIDVKSNQYSYELITSTYEKYYPGNHILEAIKEGIEKRLFFPQLHAREHMNVKRWMEDLKNGNIDTIRAFDRNMIGIGSSFTKKNRYGYMDSLNYDNINELSFLKTYLSDAVRLFQDIFGYKSETFVASCYIWTTSIERMLKDEGIHCIKTQCWQKQFFGKGTTGYFPKLHYTGKDTKKNMSYLIRNCEFEPALNQYDEQHRKLCLESVSEAFCHQKPAIINSHRVNYIGAIDENNAEQSRRQLKLLLGEIKKQWPEVEFMTAVELFENMEKQFVKNEEDKIG